MPSITQLEYIVAVADQLHFAKAAKACHITQPTLSQQINKAEEQLGVKIFDRNKKPVLITQEGAPIINQARNILREHKKLIGISTNVSSEVSGPLRVGIIPTVSAMLVPFFVNDFAKRYPKVELFIDELTTPSIIKNLQTDKLDAAILATPLHVEGLQEEPLYYETFQIYASSGHRLLKKKSCTQKDLNGKDLWLLSDGHCFKNQVLQYCSVGVDEATHSRNIHFQSGNLDTLRRLIDLGDGYTMIPSFMTFTMTKEEIKTHVNRFSSPEPAREISIVAHRNNWKNRIVASLRESILKHLPPGIHKTKNKNLDVLEIC